MVSWTFCNLDILVTGRLVNGRFVTGRYVTGRYVTGRFVGIPKVLGLVIFIYFFLFLPDRFSWMSEDPAGLLAIGTWFFPDLLSTNISKNQWIRIGIHRVSGSGKEKTQKIKKKRNFMFVIAGCSHGGVNGAVRSIIYLAKNLNFCHYCIFRCCATKTRIWI